MNIKKLGLIGATLLLAAPMWASTYYGGFEDTKGGDYDYNDLVFSLSGTNLTLNSTAKWFAKPTLGTSGAPFWNNASSDVPNGTMNVGYCIYGGGGCNSGVALDPTASYLAASNTTHTGSANDVTFSVTGTVGASITLTISSDKDQLGWYSLSSPGTLHWLNTSGSTGSFTFTPGGSFGLVGNDGMGDVYYSQTTLGKADTVSHFAFFGNPTPEPGMTGLMAAGLVAVGAMFRRRKANR